MLVIIMIHLYEGHNADNKEQNDSIYHLGHSVMTLGVFL